MNKPGQPGRICVVGSYGLGLTFVTHQAPAAGETVVGSSFQTGHGGKGSNQAVGCARLGADVHLLTVVGSDAIGSEARTMWAAERVDASSVTTIDGSTMVGAIVVEATGENRIIVVPGVLDRFEVAHLDALDSVLAGCAVLVVGLEIPVEVAAAALRRGRAAGVVTVLNPAPAKPLAASVLADVDHLIPNLHEAIALAEVGAHTAPEQLVQAEAFAAVPNVVVTLGEHGAILREGAATHRIAAVAVDAVDTTGAGDSFTAAYAVALARGCSAQAAATYANVAAAHTVTREQVIPALPVAGELPDLATLAMAVAEGASR